MSTTEVDIEVYTLQVTTLSSRRVKIRYDDVTVSNRVNLVDPENTEHAESIHLLSRALVDAHSQTSFPIALPPLPPGNEASIP